MTLDQATMKQAFLKENVAMAWTLTGIEAKSFEMPGPSCPNAATARSAHPLMGAS